MAGGLHEFPLSERNAERLLREAVRDSNKLVNTIDYKPEEALYELISNRQIIRCLSDGRVSKPPVKDAHGNWVCVSYGFYGGTFVYVTSAIEVDAGQSLKRVYIIEVDNRFSL